MFYDKIKHWFEKVLNYCLGSVETMVIVHLIVYASTILFSSMSSLFINLLTVNGIINAIRFLKTLYENKSSDLYAQYKLTELQENDTMMRYMKGFIEKRFSKYAHHFYFMNDGYVSMSQKYFLFALLQIASVLFNTLFYSYGSKLINCLLLLFATPLFNVPIINELHFLNLYKLLTDKIKQIMVYTLSKIATKILTTITEVCLDYKLKLDFNELMDFFEDYENAIMNILIFIKTVAIQSIIHYAKTTNNIFYYYVVDLIHKYQIERLVFFYKSDTALTFDKQKELLITILKDRRWDELLRPKTVHILFEFYESKNDNKFVIKIGMLLRNIRINFIRFMTLWSLGTLAPLVGIAMDFYYSFINKRFYIQQHLIPYLLGCVILYFGKLLPGAILMITSDLFIKPLFDYIDDHKLVNRYIFRSFDQIKYIAIISIITLIGHFGFLLPFILYYVNSNLILNICLFSTTALALISNYGLIHTLLAWFIITITSNIIIDTTKTNEKINLEVNVLENYLQNQNQVVQLRKRTKRDKPMIKVIEEASKDDQQPRYNICTLVTSYFKRN